MLADGFSFFEAKDLQSHDVGHAIARVERADFDFNPRIHRPEPVDSALATARQTAVQAESRKRYAMPAAEIEALLRVEVPVQQAAEAVTQQTSPQQRKGRSQCSQESTPPEGGRGGPRHQYLQSLVTRLAKDRGFNAEREREIHDGHGYVDVVLDGHDVSIAVEVSVTTKIDHEVGTLSKCLAADFDYVVFISSDDKILDLAKAEMSGADQCRLRVMKPGNLGDFLDQFLNEKRPS